MTEIKQVSWQKVSPSHKNYYALNKKTSSAFTIVVKIPKGINTDKLKYDLVFLSEIIFKTKVDETGCKKLGLLCFQTHMKKL